MCLQKCCFEFSRCSLLSKNVACVTSFEANLLAVLFTLADVLVLCLMQLEYTSKPVQNCPEFCAYESGVVV